MAMQNLFLGEMYLVCLFYALSHGNFKIVLYNIKGLLLNMNVVKEHLQTLRSDGSTSDMSSILHIIGLNNGLWLYIRNGMSCQQQENLEADDDLEILWP